MGDVTVKPEPGGHNAMLLDLAKAKAVFQQRSILAVIDDRQAAKASPTALDAGVLDALVKRLHHRGYEQGEKANHLIRRYQIDRLEAAKAIEALAAENARLRPATDE